MDRGPGTVRAWSGHPQGVLSGVGFFMQPPWKPDAPAASVAFARDSFSFSLWLCLEVSFVGPIHWARAVPENSPLHSLAAGARPPGSVGCLAQNNSTSAAVTAS